MSLITIKSTSEESTETRYSIEMEREGKNYTCQIYSSLHNSWTDWLEDGYLIERPDWADDLDVWEIYETYQGREIQ